MQRCGAFARRDIGEGFLPSMLLCVFLVAASGAPAYAADDPTACRAPVARVVSIQGSIELKRSGQSNWSKVTRLDTPLCEGDRLRTGALSRAALFIQPETLVRVDQNTSISVSQTAEETLVEFTQEDIVAASATAHTCGAGYFITRFPRKFKVRTPHLNAAVEGTEFLVAMRCEATELSVFEGKVLAEGAGANIFSAQSISSGQTLTIGGAEPPAIKLQIKPKDAVQWTLYYPPITPAGTVPAEDCRVVAPDNRASCLIARAEQRLRAGRVEEAQASIGDALAAAPYSSDAKALSSVISLVRNDKPEALRLAREAVEANANSASTWLALSYAQQADFKLEASLTSAQRASELTPSSALAFARVAELQLSLGWTRDAEKSANQAVAANPSESRAHMIMGFVHLTQIKVPEARADFERAIELDSTDPLSRLGLGLAIIRTGKLVEGREQIEIAVALEPTNSLMRSYVGKAYYEENSRARDRLAETQFDLAKERDPHDPTPWFYDSILKQTQNRPAEALEASQQSARLSDNRAVNRSRLLLDEDQAVRSSNSARIFQNLGFTRRGLLEAHMSLQGDPSSYAAHQFLADVYATQRKHQIARVSELLQTQLRQPLYSPPVEPELADDRLGGTRLSTIQGVPIGGSGEYSELFAKSGLGLHIDGLAGSRETYADEFIVSALHKRIALSVGRFHYKTEGFDLNTEAKKEVHNGFVQFQLGPATSIQAEVRSLNSERGDTRFEYDPALVLPLRIDEHIENYRIGAHHAVSPSLEFLVSSAYQHKNFKNPLVGFEPFFAVVSKWQVSEAQFVFTDSVINVAAGVSQFDGEDRIDDGSFNREVTHRIVYAYANVGRRSSGAVLTVGASDDYLDSVNLVRKETNPKIGLTLYPWEGTSLRAAWFKSIKRQIIANQTIEPTSVAGFNQFFDDPTGSKVETAGVGVDQKFGSRIFAGLSARDRRLNVPSVTATDFDDLPWYETTYSGYIYWAIPRGRLTRWSLGLSLEVEVEELERNPNITGVEGIHNLKTTHIPISVSASHPSGLSVRLSSAKILQKGDLLASPFDPVFYRDEDFWITDIDIGYRLPRRYGLISLSIRNLFDESAQFVETDAFVQRFSPERFVFGRLSLVF